MLHQIVEDDGDLYSIDEFIDMVDIGAFIDDDGYGYAAYYHTKVYDDSIKIHPSRIDEIPVGVTAVLWFNR
jgi:hypothetical protein